MKHFNVRKNMRKLLPIVLSLVVLALVGCSSNDNSEGNPDETTLEKAQRLGFVTVGFAQEKPYAYQTEEGELTGEAVEVARAILTELGIEEMNGELTEFGSLIPGLNAERYDMVTAGMFITVDRAKEVSFANPEYSIGEAIGVKAGNPLDLHSYDDIANHETATIAVPGGAIEYDYLLQSGVPEDRIVVVPDIAAALQAVKAGRADAFTATGPALQATIETAGDTDIERVMDFEQPVIDGESVRGYGATAFRKADQDFVDAFNVELVKLQETGKLLEILEDFGFTENELPGDVTIKDIID